MLISRIIPRGLAVRIVPCVGLIASSLLLAGCSSFGKKPSGSPKVDQTGSERNSGLARDKLPVSTDRTAPPPGVGGILAGQVLDSFNRRPLATFIQVTELTGPGTSGPAPIEVAADSQGYFTIQGLQIGKHYQLTARARDGGRLWAGTTIAIPPNPKLLIYIRDDAGTTPTTAVPAPGQNKPSSNSSAAPAPSSGAEKPTTGNEQAWVPGRDAQDPFSRNTGGLASPKASARAAELGPPQGIQDTSPNPPPPPPATQAKTNPNITNIPAQTGPNPFLSTPEPKTDLPIVHSGPTRIPSCDLTGRTLYNFALNDLTGQPWEYRHHHTGKLVLLDFWETKCIPCQHAIRHLRIMQDRFGPYGLEIIGISYEQGTFEEKTQKVDRVRQRLGINYRLLMGGDFIQCPVRNQFGITAYPTLVLLNENGRIIWRSEGLGGPQIEELDAIVKQKLNVR
ncbi:MAG TPA: redoxin domain-containing protein [Gemmataceae bacterium]|nr:redoxin domain-containing protein [Gemmataceae bacterium]